MTMTKRPFRGTPAAHGTQAAERNERAAKAPRPELLPARMRQPAVQQQKPAVAESARAPRPDLLPAQMRQPAVQQKRSVDQKTGWPGAPRPELLPRLGKPRAGTPDRVAQQQPQRQPADFFSNAKGGRAVKTVTTIQKADPEAVAGQPGTELVQAIRGNEHLTALTDCTSVPIRMGKAVYGKWQDDKGEVVIKKTDSLRRDIEEVLTFEGALNSTAVWHVLVGPAVHHFVIMPQVVSKNPDTVVYTVVMAYENHYTLGDYIQRAGKASMKKYGFKDPWCLDDLGNMFGHLIATPHAAHENYFGVRPKKKGPASISIWKYPDTTTENAINGINHYQG